MKKRIEVRIKQSVDPVSKRTTFYLQERVWCFFWVTRVSGAASGFDAWVFMECSNADSPTSEEGKAK